MKHPRQQIAAGAGSLVDDHHLRSLDRRQRRFEVAAVAHGPVADHRTAEDVDVVVGHAAATVVALVDDDGVAVGLREEVAFEVGIAGAGGVRHIHVRNAPVGGLGDFAKVAFDPIAVAQVPLVVDRDDLDDARAAAVSVRSDGQLDDTSRRLFEAAVEVLGVFEIATIDGQQVLTCFHIDAGLGQRRAELRIPIEAAVNLGEVGECVAATKAMVADRKLGGHPHHYAIEIAAHGQFREEHGVLGAHGVPVGAVHVRVVEVIAVDAPGFVENLPPLGARIDLDLQLVCGELELRGVELLADVDQRIAVPIRGTVEQHPLAVSGELEAVDLFEQRLFLAFLEVEALQAHLLGAGTIEAGRFEIENLTALTDLEAVVAGRLGRQRHDSLRQAIEVDDDFDRLGGRALGLVSSGFLIGRFIAGLRLRLHGRFVSGLRRLFVAFLRDRRDHAFCQNSQVDRLRRPQVGVRLREPILDRTGVSRSQEVEILSVRIEDRLAGVGVGIGQRVGLLLRDRIEVDPVHVGGRVARVGQPLRVRRPVVVEDAHRAVEDVAGNLVANACGHIDDMDRA